MKKTFLFILIIIAFYSVDSLGKYSGMIDYNFLSVNIVLVETTNNSYEHKSKPDYSNPKINTDSKKVIPYYNLDINSDVFIDTNTNIQIYKK
ncbi:MAG TPA: hypothetical protein OIM48_01620 [Clostridiaceae bacterium]|jgi:hypothetical protein|nr:hypothetical protein [Clostridium sp.]MEE0127468.1 hypothetical protein [Clostridia bacterium]HJJ11995.1 hypothetical protein [Clostridiaceae bacterium]